MVSVEKVVPWQDLEQAVRETTLLGSAETGPIHPYEDADISLRHVTYNEVSPTTLYVIRNNLAVQTALSRSLETAGYDPLELEGGLVLDDDGKMISLTPPIVEQTETDGQYVLDGHHRTSVGRWIGRSGFTAIHVSGIRTDCPSYALPNSWNDIKIVETVPLDPADKKQYRGQNYRALYRDFSALNGSRLREA